MKLSDKALRLTDLMPSGKTTTRAWCFGSHLAVVRGWRKGWDVIVYEDFSDFNRNGVTVDTLKSSVPFWEAVRIALAWEPFYAGATKVGPNLVSFQ